MATRASGGVRPAGGPARPALRVGFLLAHNFTLSALSLFVDTLRLAADEGDRSRPIRCAWSIMGATAETIRSSCGLSVVRTAPLADPLSFDYVVMVGGLLHGGEQVDDATIQYLKWAAGAGVPLIGVCTGSFILARAGLMEGRRCCVSWYHVPDYEAEFPGRRPVADQLFLVDGDRITCSGGSGVADLAAFLIRRHIGPAAAQKSLHVLQLQHARQGSDAQPHPQIGDGGGDDRVRRALLLMEQNIAEPLSIDAVAGRLGLSSRRLERLFHAAMGTKPGQVYRRLRLGHARWLLGHTGKSVTAVAVEAGFCDGAHFARCFRSEYGVAPSRARGTAGEAGRERDREPPRPGAMLDA